MRNIIKSQANVKIPGKLYLAGEYSVVNPFQPALVFAVDAFIEIFSEKSNTRLIIDESTNSIFHWCIDKNKNVYIEPDPDGNLELTAAAMTVTLHYLSEKFNYKLDDLTFNIHIKSNLENSDGKKYGYGSSGAATVAACQAIMKLFSVDEYLSSLDFAILTFKLAAIAQTRLAKLGSFGDLAASSLGGLVYYQNFDRNILKHKSVDTLDKICDIVESDWPGLILQKLKLPEAWTLSIMWSEEISSTEELLKYSGKKLTKEVEKQFLQSSKKQVQTIAKSIKTSNWELFSKSILANADNIKNYLASQNRPYFAPGFQEAELVSKSHGSCFKISGAGAGDCALAISPTPEIAARVVSDWEKYHLTVLSHKLWDYM